MAQKIGFPTALVNTSGTDVVGGALPGCVSDGNDATGVSFSRPANGPTAICDLKSWNLPARSGKPAQSSNIVLRVRALLSSQGGALYMTLSGGGSVVGQTAVTYCPPGDFEVQDLLYFFPNTTGFWDGTPSKLTLHCEFRPDDFTPPSSGTITYCALFYGEADGYVDVGASVSYEIPAAGANAAVVNAAGGSNGTATYAPFTPSNDGRLYFNYLARRIPAFTLPAGAIYSGVEFWDVLSENIDATVGTALEGILFYVNNYPSSSPDSVTPSAAVGVLCPPPYAASLVYPGRTGLIYFGGPGDTIPWSAANGWTIIGGARLMAGGYEFRSQVYLFSTTDYSMVRNRQVWLYDLTARVFYDYPAGTQQGPLMMCDH